MTEKNNSAMPSVYVAVTFVGLAMLGGLVLWQTFVVWKLWGWFVVPLGVPLPSYGSMYGLMMLVHAVRLGSIESKQEERPTWLALIKWYGIAVARFSVALVIGYLIVRSR